MKRSAFWMLLGVLFCSLCQASEGSDLKALLAPISTLQADFTQTVKSERGRILQKLSGKIWLKKPQQFRWEVKKGESRLVLTDGHTIWDYDQDLAQVTTQKLNPREMKAPLFFLTGDLGALERDFKVSRVSSHKASCLSHSNSCFQLRPKRGEGTFQWIKLGFQNETILEIELLDQLGQVSHFHFSNIELNAFIPDSKFKFNPPAGVDILNEP